MSFWIPIVIGLAVSTEAGIRTLLFVVVGLLLVCVRSILIRRSHEKISRETLISMGVLGLGIIVCASWLVVVSNLPILLPAGILAGWAMVRNVGEVRSGKNKNALRQSLGVLVLTANVVLIPYVTTGEIANSTILVWLTVFFVFLVSIANLAFKQQAKDRGGQVAGRRFADSLGQIAVMVVVTAAILGIGSHPAFSVAATLAFLLLSVVQRWFLPVGFLIRWKDPIELILLSGWGVGFVAGFYLS